MEKHDIFLSLAAAVIGGWISAMGKIISRSGFERRRISWLDLAIETPSAVTCGLMGGGLATLFGITNPLTIAAFGAVAGHLGSIAIVDLIMRFIKSRIQ